METLEKHFRCLKNENDPEYQEIKSKIIKLLYIKNQEEFNLSINQYLNDHNYKKSNEYLTRLLEKIQVGSKSSHPSFRCRYNYNKPGRKL
jgi:hypothetical protein